MTVASTQINQDMPLTNRDPTQDTSRSKSRAKKAFKNKELKKLLQLIVKNKHQRHESVVPAWQQNPKQSYFDTDVRAQKVKQLQPIQSRSRKELYKKVAHMKSIKSIDEFKIVYNQRRRSQALLSPQEQPDQLFGDQGLRPPPDGKLHGDAYVDSFVNAQLKLRQVLASGVNKFSYI